MKRILKKKFELSAINTFQGFFILFIALIAVAFLSNFFIKAASDFTIETGSYTGNGTSQSITGVGFSPDLIIIKGATGANSAVFATSSMPAGESYQLSSPSNADAITSLDSDGFSVGADEEANESGVTYYWEAFDGSGGSDFKVGSYTGNGVDDTSITGIGFQPDFVMVRSSSDGQHANWRTSDMAVDKSFYPNIASTGTTNRLQDMEADGFQVGTASQVNTDGVTYYYVAFKKATEAMTAGTYTGDGVDDNISLVTGLDFEPRYAWIQGTSGLAHRSDAISGDESQYSGPSDDATNLIQEITETGLEIGNSTVINTNTATYYYVTWGGVATPVVTSLSPTTGSKSISVTITGTDFGATRGTSIVSFGSIEVPSYNYLFWSDTSILVQIPSGADEGNKTVTVTTSAGTSNGPTFKITPGSTSEEPMSPSIISISPETLDITEVADTSFIITGNDFDQLRGVRVRFYNNSTGWLATTQENVSSTNIKVKFDDASKAKVGNYYVVVTNIIGENQGVLESAFTVTDSTLPETEQEVSKETQIPAEELPEELTPTTDSTDGSADIEALQAELELLQNQYDQIVGLIGFFRNFLIKPANEDFLISSYQYEIVSQSENPTLAKGETHELIATIKNVGTATWYQNTPYPLILGTENPRNRLSPLSNDSWLSEKRPAKLPEESIAPEESSAFTFNIVAPETAGTFTETFRPLAEKFTWLTGPEIVWVIEVK